MENENKQNITTGKTWQDTIAEVGKPLAETLNNGVDRYFDLQDKKEENRHKVAIEEHKTDRIKFRYAFIILTVCILTMLVCAVVLKDIPPALNSFVSFVVGLAVGNFLPNKKKEENH